MLNVSYTPNTQDDINYSFMKMEDLIHDRLYLPAYRLDNKKELVWTTTSYLIHDEGSVGLRWLVQFDPSRTTQYLNDTRIYFKDPSMSRLLLEVDEHGVPVKVGEVLLKLKKIMVSRGVPDSVELQKWIIQWGIAQLQNYNLTDKLLIKQRAFIRHMDPTKVKGLSFMLREYVVKDCSSQAELDEEARVTGKVQNGTAKKTVPCLFKKK